MEEKEKLKINQSLIKALANEMNCPTKVNAVYIKKTHQSIATESMVKGQFFETLCIGSGRGGSQTLDLPRLKNGAKSVDQTRIEEQAEFFKNEIVKQYEINIIAKQIDIETSYNEEVDLFGALDFIANMNDPDLGKVMAIVDLKLTANVHSQFGDFCWAFPANMDHTQAYQYHYLFTKHFTNFTGDVYFYYFVFDYSTAKGYKIIRKKITSIHKLEFEESVRKTIEKINFHEKDGWKEVPSFKECKSCPLFASCLKSAKVAPIEEI